MNWIIIYLWRQKFIDEISEREIKYYGSKVYSFWCGLLWGNGT